jgi:hypothetical protein
MILHQVSSAMLDLSIRRCNDKGFFPDILVANMERCSSKPTEEIFSSSTGQIRQATGRIFLYGVLGESDGLNEPILDELIHGRQFGHK